MYNLHEAYLSIYEQDTVDILTEDIRIIQALSEEEFVEVAEESINELLEEYTIEELEYYLSDVFVINNSINEEVISEILKRLRKAAVQFRGTVLDTPLTKYDKKHRATSGLRGISSRDKLKSPNPTIRGRSQKEVITHMAKRAADKVKKKIRGDKKETHTESVMSQYEFVVNHLIEEGYASSVTQAENIISHMSEEWISNILFINT